MDQPVIGNRGRRRRWAIVAALALGASLTAFTPSAQATVQAVNVTVNANEGLGTVPDTGYGLNQAVWDGNMNTPASVDLLASPVWG